MTLLYTPVPAQDDVMTALRSFLVSILPSGIEIVQAEESRLPEPSGADFVVMTPLLRERLGTNVEVYADCAFGGSVSGSTLTASSIQFGTIQIGAPLFVGDGRFDPAPDVDAHHFAERLVGAHHPRGVVARMRAHQHLAPVAGLRRPGRAAAQALDLAKDGRA